MPQQILDETHAREIADAEGRGLRTVEATGLPVTEPLDWLACILGEILQGEFASGVPHAGTKLRETRAAVKATVSGGANCINDLAAQGDVPDVSRWHGRRAWKRGTRVAPALVLVQAPVAGMSSHRLLTVDVFTARALGGNPVAVVLDADDIPPDDMQRVAAWTNLSETTFVLRPTAAGADYRLRIFTPRGELPFAGHPTVGSAHAALEAGVVAASATRITQECAAGLVAIRVERGDGGRRLVVRVPRADVRRAPAVDAAAVEQALGARPVADAPPSVVDVGAVWLVAAYAREEVVRALHPDAGRVAELSRRLDTVGITVFAPAAGGRLVVRSFAPLAGVVEDPVCGSGNAAVAAHVAATGRLADIGSEWIASQGREMGRDGSVLVRVADAGRTIEIGGQAVTVVDGSLAI